MAKITLPYTIQNGNTADGGQVQQDFDAILAQVNGNLDSTNLASGAVTLAKLASDVKVIENIYHSEITSQTTQVSPITSVTFSLSKARYGLVLSLVSTSGTIPANGSCSFEYWIYDSADGYIIQNVYRSFINNFSYDVSANDFATLFSLVQFSAAEHETKVFFDVPGGSGPIVNFAQLAVILFNF